MTAAVVRPPRPIREKTFLDDPSLYPEYEALTSTLPTLHALRRGFHVHRTASLLLILAVCVALSGVPVPVPAADGTVAVAEWLDFAFRSMAIGRLVDQFEGMGTGFAAMGVVASISILVYPLHSLVSPRTTAAATTDNTATTAPSGGGGGRPVGTYVVAVGLPSAAVWAIAVWAQRRAAWGLVPGLWLALFCACVTLKITSFVASVATPNEPASASSSSSTTGAGSSTAVAAADPRSLTFGEYLFFMFLSPSLVCEVRLMKVSARRPSRPLRAASEFFHAVLTFLCAHCVVGTFLAPSLRLLFSALRPDWVEGAAAGWAELEAAGGAGWPSWTAGSAFLAGGDKEESGLGHLVTLGCFLWMLVVVSSTIHFMLFYAFWHCVCLGMAELWGFPDRDLYGCWWLLFDEPRDFLRMWSVPVHRWLSACVYWPMLELCRASYNGVDGSKSPAPPAELSTSTAAAAAAAPSKWTWVPAVVATFVVSGVFHEAVLYVAMHGTCWPFNTFLVCVGGVLVIFWDIVFPLTDLKRSSEPEGGNPPQTAALSSKNEEERDGAIGSRCEGGGGGKKVVRAYGHRGLVSIASCCVSIQLSAFIADCAAWLWWRHIHMKN